MERRLEPLKSKEQRVAEFTARLKFGPQIVLSLDNYIWPGELGKAWSQNELDPPFWRVFMLTDYDGRGYLILDCIARTFSTFEKALGPNRQMRKEYYG